MWVPAVGPEEEQPVEQRLDVDHIGFPLWKDPEDAAVVLERKADQCFTNMLNFELNISSLNYSVFFSLSLLFYFCRHDIIA